MEIKKKRNYRKRWLLSKVFNIIVLGVAAKHMDFSKEAWLDVIEKTVPPKTVEINKKAFLLGFES